MKHVIRFVLACSLSSSLGVLASVDVLVDGDRYQSIASIHQQVKRYVDNYPFDSAYHVQVAIAAIDSRLRLRRCETALDIGFIKKPQRPGRMSVLVRCAGKKSWQIYVSTRIEMQADVLVSQQPILRGQALSSAALAFDQRQVSDLRGGYFVDPEALENMQAARVIQRGQVITPALLKPQYFVTKGQQVTLVASISGIKVRMKGQALANAASKDPVQVRNISSGRIVEGVVVARGVVNISM